MVRNQNPKQQKYTGSPRAKWNKVNEVLNTTSDKKDTATDLRGHCIRLYVVAAANQTYQSAR